MGKGSFKIAWSSIFELVVGEVFKVGAAAILFQEQAQESLEIQIQHCDDVSQGYFPLPSPCAGIDNN